jgi:DNA modification methylase
MNPGYHVGDCLDLLAQMPPESVHCCVTSPPYYALRSYLPEDHPAKDREIGSEPTLDAFLATMVTVFRAVHRVLRDDGTLWLNIGDSYAAGAGCRTYGSSDGAVGRGDAQGPRITDLPPKNLLMVPARVALALQADGWILRSDIIWSKPNPMPESCRDRPTNAHEHLFLLAKRPRYFYDGDAVREAQVEPDRTGSAAERHCVARHQDNVETPTVNGRQYNPAGRNLRNVWTIPTQAVKYKHYATFPEKLVEPCIKAGTSQEGVCVECGAPWERVREAENHIARYDRQEATGGAITGGVGKNFPDVTRTTTGWRPTCGCDAGKKPALVLDPFMGSGTVARVAERLGREWVGFDLDERNRDMCELRLKRNQMELAM